MFLFKDKKVLITGGSSGLGLALTKLFLKKGSLVVICGRNKEKLESTRKKLKSNNLSSYVCDVSNYEQIEKVIKKVGSIDILVNNAGIFENGELDELDAKSISRVIDVNLKGLIYTTRIVLPKMKKQKSGIIVNISSTSGIMPKKSSSVYTATKFGVRGFSESLTLDLAETNIKVLGIYPGGMRTDLFKNAKLSVDNSNWTDPKEVANIIISMIEKSDILLMDYVVVNRIKN